MTRLDPIYKWQTLTQQLERQLLQLASQASQIDQQAPAWQRRDWFDSDLFQCHSPQLLDYVQETMTLLQRLQQPLRSSGELLISATGTWAPSPSRLWPTKRLAWRITPGQSLRIT